MIKQCTVELGADNTMFTNFDELDIKTRSKIHMLGVTSESGFYKRPISDLRMIADNSEHIFLRSPAALLAPYTLAYDVALEYFKDPRRILACGDYIDIIYNQLPTTMDEDYHVSRKDLLKDDDITSGKYIWNSLFLYSWNKIHKGEKDYLLRGQIQYTYTSDVTGMSNPSEACYGLHNLSKLDTLSMLIYEAECAFYVAPFRIYKLTGGHMTPAYMKNNRVQNHNGDPSYEFIFIVDKGYLSPKVLKELKRFGSLISGTALQGIDGSDIDGFQCTRGYW